MGVSIPDGTFLINSTVRPLPDVPICGSAQGRSVLKLGADNIELFGRHSLGRSGTFILRDVTLHGYADRNSTLGSHKLLNCGPFDVCILDGVSALYSRNMSLAPLATSSFVVNCDIRKSLRDAINTTGATHHKIIGNHIEECGDDAIAVHLASSTTGVNDTSVVITNNVIRKSFGIKVLGARNAVISNNGTRFAYGYAIFIGLDTNFSEGLVAKFAVVINGNSILDTLRTTDVGSVGTFGAIYINGRESLGSGGSAITTYIDDYDGSAWVKPEPYVNVVGPNAPRGANKGIVISSNSIMQTIGGQTNFSDYGFGSLWNDTGVIDPEISSLIYAIHGIRAASADFNGLTIAGNQAYGVASMFSLGGNVRSFKNVLISGNTAQRCSNGVVLNPSAPVLNATYAVRGNFFDIDPLHENAARNSNGGWSATSGSDGFGVYATGMARGAIEGNSFQQCRRPVRLAALSGSGSIAAVRGNHYYWDWSSGNKGIALIEQEFGNFSHWIDCDPDSETRGQGSATPDGGDLLSASAMPSSGYFRAGHFVENTALSISSGSLLRGWLRLTNGNAHVEGTDWAPIYNSAEVPA